MSFYPAKITPADRWFSFYIRFRDNWTCRSCGKYCPQRRLNNPDLVQAKIECAHIFSRRHKSVRFDPKNAMALCFKCHERYTEDNPAWEAFVIEKMGEDEYNQLRVRRMMTIRYQDPKAISKEFREAVMEIAKKKGMLWIVKK